LAAAAGERGIYGLGAGVFVVGICNENSESKALFPLIFESLYLFLFFLSAAFCLRIRL
jgi:hypothetical protein